MPFKHTKTELSLLARDEAKITASIVIGVSVCMAGGSIGPVDVESRYQQRKIDCEADAKAIYELLNEHLPEETRSKLSYLYRIEGT